MPAGMPKRSSVRASVRASMGISCAGWVAEATQAPVSMSISDTFTEEEPMSMPKLFMNAKIGVAGSSNFGK